MLLALIRQHRRDLSAPEELGESGDSKMVDEAKTYRWFSLSAGKGQDIHVRGFVFALSGRGGVKSSDVGVIYLHHAESHVAISEKSRQQLRQSVKGGHLTDGIKVTQIISPTIPKGRDKAKRGRKKSSFGQHRQHRSSGWSPDDRTDKPKLSGPKRDKPLVMRNHLLMKSHLGRTGWISLDRQTRFSKDQKNRENCLNQVKQPDRIRLKIPEGRQNSVNSQEK